MRLPGKTLQHIFEEPSEILHSIKKFYITETLKQVYKIVGSLDIVGNPTMLLGSFFTGLRDLVMTPSMALWKTPTNPSRLGLSVAQGTLSLVSHSVSGFFGVLTKLAARTGQGVAILSLDPDFRVWHRDKVLVEATNLNRDWKRRGVQKAEQMITRPIFDLLLGFAGGLTGFFVAPLHGYKRDGRLGVLKGVAIGSIGLIAKPTVGVLDALAHFTASIHDIAKSANVLEKRLQPAMKLRLPYTFGMMSILSPYEPISSLAVSLLKRFPMKEAGVDCDEVMVHAELLPSFENDNYAIVTSTRIVLLRVKKQASGVLSSTRCWQLAFSSESHISSKVKDRGHNGVALALVKRTHVNRTTQSDFNNCGVSEIPLVENNNKVTSYLELISPDEAVELSEDHETERDGNGKVLEWYTIFAEYQYRRQLTRLHNAISSIQGNFNEVVYDPSLGRHGSSTDGYTSFGIYFFEEHNTADDTLEITAVGDHLENLPWVRRNTLLSLQEMSAHEQKAHLSAMRSKWGLREVLEASRLEGGPEWLVIIRAEASFVEGFATFPFQLPSMVYGEEHAAEIFQNKSKPKLLDHRSSGFILTSQDEKGTEDARSYRERLSLSEYRPALEIPILEDSGEIDSRLTYISPDDQDMSLRADELMISSDSSCDSSSEQRSFTHTKTNDFDQRLLYYDSAKVEQSRDRKENCVRSGSFVFPTDERSDTANKNLERPSAELGTTLTSSGLSGDTEYLNRKQATSSSVICCGCQSTHRMERMEVLLERLLLFGSEQVLLQQHCQGISDEVVRFRHEVNALRSQVEIYRAKQEMALAEIASHAFSCTEAHLGLDEAPNESSGKRDLDDEAA